MLKSYMYTHRRGILAFFLMMLAAACIIRLYELPPEAVGYTAAVSGFIGAVFLLEDFMRFRKHACVLGTLHREALVSPDSLPEPQNDLEAQYLLPGYDGILQHVGAPDQDANCGGTMDFTKRAAAGRRAFAGGLCGAAGGDPQDPAVR